jgi:hypothetical protein
MGGCTEVKVCVYDGELEGLIKKYSKEFTAVPAGDPGVQKYVLFKEEVMSSYLIMVSKGAMCPEYNYNTIATVTGAEERTAKKIMQEFQKKTGLEMKPAPEFLKKVFENLSALVSGPFPNAN